MGLRKSKDSQCIRRLRARQIAFLFSFSASICASQAASNVTLAWDANAELNIASYILYVGQQSDSYTQRIDVGDVTQATITDLQPGITYYFAVAALNTLGLESDPSPEISYAVPDSGPVRPRLLSIFSPAPRKITLTWTSIPGSTYRVASKNDLSDANWVDFSQNITANASVTSWTGPLSSSVPCKFFMIRLLAN